MMYVCKCKLEMLAQAVFRNTESERMITPKKTFDQVGEHNHYFQESEVLR